jgi:hypothetical protein
MMVGSAACIPASSIVRAWRRVRLHLASVPQSWCCAARSRAHLELPARGDTSHTTAPVAPLIAAKTDVDPDRTFYGLPDFERGGGAVRGEDSQPAVWQQCDVTNLGRVRVCRTLERSCSGHSDTASQCGGARSGRETGLMNHHPDGIVGRARQWDFQSFARNLPGPAS